MNRGTCVTHVPWCMSRSITHGGGENVPSIPVACATGNFTYLERGPLNVFFPGFGTSFMFFLPIWVSVENFPARVRGSIIGFTIAFARCGSTVFGVIYTRFYQEVPIGNFFLLVAILCVLANLLSMWVLRPLPVQVNSDILKEEGLQKVYSVCFVADNGSEPANSWYAHLGIGLMKVPAFHIFSWCLFLSSAPQSAIISNITTMANSFGHKGLAMRLINYGHIVGLLITPLIGVISDWTLEYASRLVYVILGHIPLFLFLIVSIFYGDNSNIFSGLVLSSYIQIGSHSATVPTLITEYFGCHYFVRVMGAKTLTIALLETILNISIGALYQDAIIDGGTDCYGLVCFQHSFILVCVMCGMSLLLCGVLWYMERKKAQEYESMKWVHSWGCVNNDCKLDLTLYVLNFSGFLVTYNN